MPSLVSVVVPCYNAERFVRETLESVFAQTWPSIETIVVDDGSTDGTLAVLERMRAEGRPFTLLEQDHGGASAARNRGTAAAKGDFIQYLDADDLLTPGSVASKAASAESSGADVVYTDWRRLEEAADGSFVPGETVSRRLEDVHADPEIAIFTTFWAPPAAILYRRRIVDAVGGWKESVPVIQDARFLLDAALGGATFARVPEVTALYRVHRGQSLSTRNRRAFLEDIYAQAVDVRRTWTDRGMNPERKRALLSALGFVARAAYESDPDLHAKARAEIRAIEPRYVPERPFKLRLASVLMGYDNAEKTASLYRRAKRALRGGRP